MRCEQLDRAAFAMEVRAVIYFSLIFTFSTFAPASPPSTQPSSSSQPAAATLEIRIYRPKYLAASRLAEIITKTFITPPQTRSGMPPDANEFGFVRAVVTEPQSNSVIVVSDSAAHDTIQRILDSLTVETEPSTEVHIFQLPEHEEAKNVAELLNGLFKDAARADAFPRSRCLATVDPGSNTLLVVADRGEMRLAEDVVAKVVAGDAENAFQVTTVHVNHVSATRAAAMLRHLFVSADALRTSHSPRRSLNDPFRAVADEDRKLIILAGSNLWVHRAEQALKGMDVEANPTSTQPTSPAKN